MMNRKLKRNATEVRADALRTPGLILGHHCPAAILTYFQHHEGKHP